MSIILKVKCCRSRFDKIYGMSMKQSYISRTKQSLNGNNNKSQLNFVNTNIDFIFQKTIVEIQLQMWSLFLFKYSYCEQQRKKPGFLCVLYLILPKSVLVSTQAAIFHLFVRTGTLPCALFCSILQIKKKKKISCLFSHPSATLCCSFKS